MHVSPEKRPPQLDRAVCSPTQNTEYSIVIGPNEGTQCPASSTSGALQNEWKVKTGPSIEGECFFADGAGKSRIGRVEESWRSRFSSWLGLTAGGPMTERSPDLKNEEEADSSALYRLPLQRPQLSRESQKHRWTDWGAGGRYYWPLSGRRQAALMGFLGCSRWEKLRRGRVEHIHSAARRKEILHASELRTAVVTEFVVGEQRQQTILSGPAETGKNKATSSSHYLNPIRRAEEEI